MGTIDTECKGWVQLIVSATGGYNSQKIKHMTMHSVNRFSVPCTMPIISISRCDTISP